MRKEIMQLFYRLSRYLADGRLRELTLTTNATQLSRYAEELGALGVRRINVSLDTLDPDKFAMITRGGSLARVLEGIEAARTAGLAVKLNAVALKGFTEDEIDELINFAHAGGDDADPDRNDAAWRNRSGPHRSVSAVDGAASPDRAALDAGRSG